MKNNKNNKSIGFGTVIFDIFMTVITGGLWLIWIAYKFFKHNS